MVFTVLKKSAFAAPAVRRQRCCKEHGERLATKRRVNTVRRLWLFKCPQLKAWKKGPLKKKNKKKQLSR